MLLTFLKRPTYSIKSFNLLPIRPNLRYRLNEVPTHNIQFPIELVVCTLLIRYQTLMVHATLLGYDSL